MPKQVGPLSISHVALQVNNDHKSIKVVFIAMLKLGTICFSLVELGLSLDLTSIKPFSDFMKPNFTPILSSLALVFRKPPKLAVKTLILKQHHDDAVRHAGGPRTKFGPSDLVGQLNAFLNSTSGSPCVVVAKGFYWLAVGIVMQAFKVLDIDAVLSIELTDTDDFVIAITALASTLFPRTGTDKDASDLMEIGVVITLDTGHGYLLTRGELMPQFFVLSRDCHMRGGITYATWLSPSPYAGDFILSIGGYHHLFRPPAYLPPEPDQISI
ncbi:hypothetical protein F5Y19DRAFT_493310 [Xylariaceae sp. FL1651]|nr:hypothetical protein F5Y19DRAFT_493310 [Xylariaceae sp. FL1651]